jgi:cell division septation protein DedD
MAPPSRLLTLALALLAFPQASTSAQADDAVQARGRREAATPGTERRLRIILETEAAEAGAAGSQREGPGFDVAPLAPIAVAEHYDVEPPAEWTLDAMRTPLAPGEGWRIQVGAFSEEARAQAAIAALETVAAGPGADPVRLVTRASNASPAIYRAQMSGFLDRDAAEAACARIETRGSDCFLVAPATP